MGKKDMAGATSLPTHQQKQWPPAGTSVVPTLGTCFHQVSSHPTPPLHPAPTFSRYALPSHTVLSPSAKVSSPSSPAQTLTMPHLLTPRRTSVLAMADFYKQTTTHLVKTRHIPARTKHYLQQAKRSSADNWAKRKRSQDQQQSTHNTHRKYLLKCQALGNRRHCSAEHYKTSSS